MEVLPNFKWNLQFVFSLPNASHKVRSITQVYSLRFNTERHFSPLCTSIPTPFASIRSMSFYALAIQIYDKCLWNLIIVSYSTICFDNMFQITFQQFSNLMPSNLFLLILNPSLWLLVSLSRDKYFDYLRIHASHDLMCLYQVTLPTSLLCFRKQAQLVILSP